MPKEWVDVTTHVGCPCECLKYCPQEVLVKRYTSPQKNLTVDNFERVLKNLPKSLPINFSGFCEPFANSDLVELMEVSAREGHEIGLLTTLYGSTRAQIERLLKLKLGWVYLHLPDAQAFRIPITQEYKDNFFELVTNVRNLTIMQMNDTFKTNNRENVTRGIAPPRKSIGVCLVDSIEHPHPILMPNGDVYLCCMDMNLDHKVGNLLTEHYNVIRRRIQTGRFELCQVCYWNRPRVYVLYNQLATLPRRAIQKLL